MLRNQPPEARLPGGATEVLASDSQVSEALGGRLVIEDLRLLLPARPARHISVWLTVPSLLLAA